MQVMRVMNENEIRDIKIDKPHLLIRPWANIWKSWRLLDISSLEKEKKKIDVYSTISSQEIQSAPALTYLMELINLIVYKICIKIYFRL